MADDTDVLLKYCDEAWQEMRHIEDQRAAITNISIVISSVIVGYMAEQKALTLPMLPLSVLMIFLGIYGVVAVIKLYERHQLARNLLAHWTKHVEKLRPKSKVLKLLKTAERENAAQFPKMSKIRLNWLWTALHVVIMLVGIGITVYILAINP